MTSESFHKIVSTASQKMLLHFEYAIRNQHQSAFHSDMGSIMLHMLCPRIVSDIVNLQQLSLAKSFAEDWEEEEEGK